MKTSSDEPIASNVIGAYSQNRCLINGQVCSQSLPLPHSISAKCGGRRHERDSKAYNALNPRSAEVWRQTGREREFRVSAGVPQCGGLCAKGRCYWRFSARQISAEKLVLEGLAEERNRIQWSPKLECPEAHVRRALRYA